MTGAVATPVPVAAPERLAGNVLAISFLETPLKFRAPGITVPLRLGIGRLVLRVRNAVELALAVTLTGAILTDKAGVNGRVAGFAA
ncbi:MAG: hypothetical protein ACRDRR_11940 [Pseudonocardiaceae bacterium]